MAEMRTRGACVIREGKGKKDRVVPIGERAVAWLEKYLDEARPEFVAEPDEGVVFLTSTGRAFHPNHCSRLIRGYVAAAGIQKRGRVICCATRWRPGCWSTGPTCG